MDTLTTTKSPTPPKAPRRWTPAVVAAAIVLLLGVSSVIWLTDGAPFAGREMTPVEIAEAYMTAVDTYDSEKALELLAEEVLITDVGAYTEREDLEAGFIARQRWELTVSPFECEQRSEEQVVCAYSLDSRLQEITDYPPIEATFRFTIGDGAIVQVSDGFPLGEFSPNLFAPLVRWLNTEHPGAFDALFYRDGGLDRQRLTPEALDLVTVYLDLYEEWLDSQEG